MMGAASLLRKYCSLLVSHVSNVLATATTVGEKCARSFANVTAIISKDVTGMASHFPVAWSNKHSYINCVCLLDFWSKK